MKNEELGMRNMNVVGRILVCLAAVLLVACFNLHNPLQEDAPAAGKGKVVLSVSENSGRTVLPEEPVFVKYEFIFEAVDGQEGHDKVTVTPENSSSVSVELAQGRWNIIAKGYVHISGIDGIQDGDYKAAEGRIEDFMLYAGANEYLYIDIESGVQVGEKGIFSWDISFYDDAVSAVMIIRTIEGEVVEEVDIMAQPQDYMVLDAAYYLLTIKIDDGRPKTEMLHIYGGLTSRVERTLYRTPAFSKLSDLAYYLGNVPDNTADTPYDIILYGLSTEYYYLNELFQLYELFQSLNGKYVNLDMGACKVQTISTNIWDTTNRDRIVSIILPAELSSIGSEAFYYCSGLTSITIPDSVTSIGN